MEKSKCKICRRLGVKLFLRENRCLSVKCAMVKRAYPPGIRSKRGRKQTSEYGKELIEKQRLKNWYNLREKQFRNYVKEILDKKGKVEDTSLALIEKLESRFDNVVFRLGFSSSRAMARQMVNHGHFLVNGRKMDIPSYKVKKGDKIKIREGSLKKAVFKNNIKIKEEDILPWLKYDSKKIEAEVVGTPFIEESSLPSEVASIFEFYSK